MLEQYSERANSPSARLYVEFLALIIWIITNYLLTLLLTHDVLKPIIQIINTRAFKHYSAVFLFFNQFWQLQQKTRCSSYCLCLLPQEIKWKLQSHKNLPDRKVNVIWTKSEKNEMAAFPWKTQTYYIFMHINVSTISIFKRDQQISFIKYLLCCIVKKICDAVTLWGRRICIQILRGIERKKKI